MRQVDLRCRGDSADETARIALSPRAHWSCAASFALAAARSDRRTRMRSRPARTRSRSTRRAATCSTARRTTARTGSARVIPEQGQARGGARRAMPPEGADVRIAVSLTDAQGATIARDQTIGRTAISVSAEVMPATYLIAIASNHPEARFDYTVTAQLVRPPPPPPPKAKPARRPTRAPAKPAPPRFETKRAERARGRRVRVRTGGPCCSTRARSTACAWVSAGACSTADARSRRSRSSRSTPKAASRASTADRARSPSTSTAEIEIPLAP